MWNRMLRLHVWAFSQTEVQLMKAYASCFSSCAAFNPSRSSLIDTSHIRMYVYSNKALHWNCIGTHHRDFCCFCLTLKHRTHYQQLCCPNWPLMIPIPCARLTYFALHNEVVHSCCAVHCKLRGSRAHQAVFRAPFLQLLPQVRQTHTSKLQQLGLGTDSNFNYIGYSSTATQRFHWTWVDWSPKGKQVHTHTCSSKTCDQ